MSHSTPGAVPTEEPSPGERAASTPLGQLLSDATRDLSELFRQEIALAKAELAESGKKAGRGAGLLSGAGVAALFTLLFLSIAAWWGLGYLIGNAWSAVVVAVVYAIVAAVLALRGRKELKTITGVPQTVATAKEVPEALKPSRRKQ